MFLVFTLNLQVLTKKIKRINKIQKKKKIKLFVKNKMNSGLHKMK